MASTKLRRLFEPGRIGTMTLKNRIAMAPMGTQMYADGFVTEQLKDYYEARARGGVGLITIDHLKISYPVGAGKKNTARIDDDKFIPGLSQLLEVVHRHGAKMVAQLGHMGPADILSGTRQPLAASPLMRQADYTHPPASVVDYAEPRAMTNEEIAHTTRQFAEAAIRAKKAGFDAVQVHTANRYLLASFVSPYWNRRRDEYGGSLENRARFPLEVVRAVREAVGADFPIVCRVNGEERDVEGGISIELAAQFARLLEAAGVDAIDVSSMHPHSPEYAPGFNVAAAHAIKKSVGIPVIVAGRLDPERGERVLAEGSADFICIGRPMIADPWLPTKAAEDRMEDVVPCVYCVNCLAVDRECTVNPTWGKERSLAIVPASRRRKVVVVGGGPGGMEAARVAALRGHDVSLYEKESALGGQLRLASLLREEYERLVSYLGAQLGKLGVKVALGTAVDADFVRSLQPDAVIIATGAVSCPPAIAGMDSPNVITAADIRGMLEGKLKGASADKKTDARWIASYLGLKLAGSAPGRRIARTVLKHWTPFGKRVVVVGRGLPGIELAHFLVERGVQVSMVDTREEPAFGERPMPVLREFMRAELEKHATPRWLARSYEGIDERGLTIVDTTGEHRLLEADTFIFVSDFCSITELAQALKGQHPEVHSIGDCKAPCGILDAIRDGYLVSQAL